MPFLVHISITIVLIIRISYDGGKPSGPLKVPAAEREMFSARETIMFTSYFMVSDLRYSLSFLEKNI